MRASALLSALFLSLAAASRPAAAQPAVPTPVAPASGASAPVPLTISWSAVLDPSQVNGGYNWQVSLSASFSPVVLMRSTDPATTADTVSGLVSGTYFWRVQAVDGAGQQGAWSMPWSFTVTGAGPGTPGTPVLGPTQGYSTFHPWESIRFNWPAVPDAVTYRLEVSNDASFPLGPVPPGVQTFWFDNIATNTGGYVHTIEGNWFARVFAVSADNPQTGIRSLPSNVIQFSCFFGNPIGPPPALLSPLGNPTLTLPVPLTWAHVPNPQAMGYVLEVAKDPGFSNVEWFFNQYTEPTTTMLSLTSGPKFWRVLSQQGLSSPTTNANTDWSETGTFTISSAPSTPVSIAPLGIADMAMYSGAAGMVALQLTAGVPASGASIPLTSSHPSLAPVPATVSMPGTHAWAQFPITVGQVTSPTVVTLTATLNGVSASNQFNVLPPTLNDTLSQAGPTLATGGAQMTGWVDLKGLGLAGPGGFVVSLSTDASVASVPPAVTIPEGVSGTSFPIQTSPVTATTRVTITASAGTVTTSWPITLTPAPAPTSFFVRPMSTTKGSQGVVTTAEGIGHDQLVQVSSSNPALAAVPPYATVAAVSGIGRFDVTTGAVTSPTTVTISVSGGGVTLSHPLTIYPTLPALTGLTVSPTSVVGGNPATGTVTLASAAPPTGVSVNVETSLPLAARAPASVTVPGGATSASFTVTTFPADTTTVQLSAALDNVFQAAALGVHPPAPAPALAAVSVNPTSIAGGNSARGTVTLSAAAPSGGVVVSLSSDSSTATVPGSVSVPGGATSATFTVATSTVTASTAVIITGSRAGVSRTATLTVTPAPPPAPSAPSLLSPASQATVAQPITFDWTDVASAATYEIQIDDTSGFTAPLTLSQTVSVSTATISGLPAQPLWWRVRAVSAAGVNGPFSAARAFTVQGVPGTPSLSSLAVSPTTVVGGSGATGTVALTSAAPSGGFTVSLSSGNATVAAVPASVTVASSATSATFAISTAAVQASTAVAITATAAGASRTATLTVTAVATGPLPAPSLLSPAADARFSLGQAILFDWSDVAGAGTYTIQVAGSSAFSAPLVLEQTVSASQLGTSTLPAQRLWWRVRATDASGNPGNWSGIRRFEVRD